MPLSGLDRFFGEFGDSMPSRTVPPPELDEPAQAERMREALALAPKYRIENLTS